MDGNQTLHMQFIQGYFLTLGDDVRISIYLRKMNWSVLHTMM